MNHRRRRRRGYNARSLIDLLAGDLPTHQLERIGPGRARFKGEPPFEVRERVERRFLGHTVIAMFTLRLLRSSDEEVSLSFRHSGKLKRGAVEGEVIAAGQDARDLLDAVMKNPSFATHALALDFTRFEIKGAGREWTATVELVGATMVTIILPPVRSYVRLYPDQREALLGCFRGLAETLGEDWA